jgi:hypothetical protein
MVLNSMVGNSDKVHGLYEKYLSTQGLHVSVYEMLESKKDNLGSSWDKLLKLWKPQGRVSKVA